MKIETQHTTAQRVLNFVVAHNCASEEKPLTLGNVEFWHEIPGFGVGLCYSEPTARWDIEAVQDDLNRAAEKCWDALVEHLKNGGSHE